jgi:hypothetical protein
VLAGTDEAGLVREHDGVDAIAQIELGEDAVDVRLLGFGCRLDQDEPDQIAEICRDESASSRRLIR